MTRVSELRENSMWQKGPKFLEQPLKLWPIRNELEKIVEILPYKIAAIAMNVDTKIAKSKISTVNLWDIQVDNYNNYEKMIRVTSILLKVAEDRSFKGAGKSISRENFPKAEVNWIDFVQNSLPDDWETKFQRLMVTKNDENVIIVGSKMANWIKTTWIQTSFPLLPVGRSFTQLLISPINNKYHLGVETTVAKLRARFWVPCA